MILHEDHSTPVVAVNVWYHVGSKNESAGRTGFAHLFEHMMFQGFQGYPYAFGATMDELGASRNGSTNTDRTNYYEVVPSNFLETALFMEAGRMGRLLETVTQERLDNQRDVVKNEKRQRIDNQPYGQAFNRIMSALYPREHPYSWPVIGSMEDLTAASLEDVSAFFRTYYAPNNASLVLAGDFDPVRARALVEKHFGAIASGAAVKRPQPAQPRLDREIREDMEDSVQLPRLYLAWHSTPMFSKSEAAADLLAIILGSGKSSRLYKALQFDRQIVQDAFAGNPASELAGLFLVTATAKPGQNLGEIQRVIDDEIAKLKTTPVTAEEIERAYVELRVADHPRPADRLGEGRTAQSVCDVPRRSRLPGQGSRALPVGHRCRRAAGGSDIPDRQARRPVRAAAADSTGRHDRRPEAGGSRLRPLRQRPRVPPPRHPRPSPRRGPRRRSGPGRWICRCCRRGAPIRS